jgi:oxaloacetate decarboxylase alpha subunit
VGTQAVFNVLMGERYKTCTKEFKGIVRGEYGKTPMPIDPEFTKKIIGDEAPITGRPADRLSPELDALREKIAGYIEQDEDVLSYALFEQVAIKFFEARKAKKYGLDAVSADAKLGVHSV